MIKQQSIHTYSDEQLAELYRQEKDNTYLEVLFKKHIRFVFLICLKYLKEEDSAKDLSMQVFEKLMGDLGKFQIEHFKPWLHTVTKNTCLMYLRSMQPDKKNAINMQNLSQDVMESSTLLHLMDDSEDEIKLEKLEKAMIILEKDQKACIELFYLHEKSYKEVADITGFSLNQVKSHIQNGKRNLKNFLTTQEEFLICLILYLTINN